MTLKSRIILIFLLSSMIPFSSIGLISYYTLHSMLTNKIENGIEMNLNQVARALENTITNLNHVSQQLAYQGTIGQQLDQLLSSDKPYDRSELTDQIKKQLSLVTFTNPNIGLTMYYFDDDKKTMFENFPARADFSLDKLPLLANYFGISYFGPHLSNNRFDNQYVLSVLRKVELPNRDDVYIYIESGLHLTQNILSNSIAGESVSYLILDNDGRIAFSEVPEVYPVNARFPDNRGGVNSGSNKAFAWFKEKSQQGWSVVFVIPKNVYNKEINRWYVQVALVSLVFLLVTFLLAWLLWKMVYRPLSNFNREIKRLTSTDTDSALVATKIPEFDFLLGQLRSMKGQIWNLFREVEKKEKLKLDLEVEKLLYQINPHFLMNTLDTVHWLAVMNGQSEIDRLIQALNKLLYYNLGKMGQASSIADEVDALKQYLTLQQIRYDFKFDVQIQVDESTLNMPIPRFILQPLLENSLYHGLSDDGYIRVNINQKEDIIITIEDNGAGMSEETIERLLNETQVDQRKIGLGIGMNYVKRMLEITYGQHAKLEILSEIGAGTCIRLILPRERS